MIDTDNEQLKLLTRAPPYVPGRPHISSLIRWASRGVKGVKLETVVIGGRRYTSIEAIGRFITRLNASETSGTVPPQKNHQDNQVEKALDEARIK